MRRLAYIAAAALLAGCATERAALPAPQGDPLGPGMVTFSEVERTQGDRESVLEPWEPSPFYAALATIEPDGSYEQTPDVEEAERARGARPLAARSSSGATAKLFFEFYSNTWSRADGATCRFSPTCSGFGRQAVARHGLLGVVMTFGRLHRNHSDAEFYDADGPRLRDPVDLHDFWFTPHDGDTIQEEPRIGAYLQVEQARRYNLPAPPTPAAKPPSKDSER